MTEIGGWEAELERTEEDLALMEHVVRHYQERLRETPRALEYLERRGLVHPELLDRFRLGFAERTLSETLPGKPYTKEREAARSKLKRLGVLRTSGHEHFRGCLVIPVMDERGRVVEIYGRTLLNESRRGHPPHRYLSASPRGVWNRVGMRSTRDVILCESLIDALTFWVAGYRAVTASYGVNGFTAEHRAVLRANGVRRIKIAYGADREGDEAAEVLARDLAVEGIESLRVQFPWGMDANAYALGNGPASEILGAVLDAAVPIEVETTPTRMTSASPESANLTNAPDPAPSSVVEDLGVEIRAEEILIPLGDRQYRIRGLERNLAYDLLRVNVLVRRGEALHVDTLDLYQAKRRDAFARAAAGELGVSEDAVKRDLGRVLLALEELQDRQIRAALEPKRPEVTLSPEEKEEALALLRAPDLLDRIVSDFRRAGVVGEETNKLVGYVAAVSRKLERPLAVVVQSASAAGKTSLMDAVLSFVPEEERVQYSALTGQSLFYMEGANLSHKILAIVEEEGAERASYALKLLQSEGELTIASTGKDQETGKLTTREYRVEGPVMIFLTTTSAELDEELLNRCLVLTVSEDRDQTRAIHRIQRERRTLDGLLRTKERDALLTLHRNAQRLLRPFAVVNPYAPKLTFLDDRTRTRRDHEKYLTLIDAVTLLHQHQRSVKRAERGGRTIEYVEVTLEDIAAANRLADQVLGRSLDELPPQSRVLLRRLEAMVAETAETRGTEGSEVWFTRWDVRRYTGWSDFQVRTHLKKLESLEYVLAHRGGPGSRYRYELLYRGEGSEGDRFLMGLADVEALRNEYDQEGANCEGSGTNSEGSGRRLRAPVEGGVRVRERTRKPYSPNAFRPNCETRRKRASGWKSSRLRHTHTHAVSRHEGVG